MTPSVFLSLSTSHLKSSPLEEVIAAHNKQCQEHANVNLSITLTPSMTETSYSLEQEELYSHTKHHLPKSCIQSLTLPFEPSSLHPSTHDRNFSSPLAPTFIPWAPPPPTALPAYVVASVLVLHMPYGHTTMTFLLIWD